MSKEECVGYVKKEKLYIAVILSLLIGFLSGVVFAIYKSPGGNGTSSSTATQEQTQGGGHDLATVEAQVTASPDDPAAWTHLGDAYFDADQPAKAIKAYVRSLELSPGNPDVLTDLGVMYRRNKQSDEALLAFDRAIKASPAHEQARMNKGVVLMYDKKDQDKAFQVWEELLSINPNAKIPSGQSLKEFMTELQKQ